MPRPKGVDPRVDEILKDDRTGHWFETSEGDGFGRRRQIDRTLPGYEDTDAYNAHPRDVITWTWLDDIGLVDREGQYARTETDKLTGISILKAHLEAIAKRLGEI